LMLFQRAPTARIEAVVSVNHDPESINESPPCTAGGGDFGDIAGPPPGPVRNTNRHDSEHGEPPRTTGPASPPTMLVNNGMPLEEVSRYLGHSSTDVTRRYAQQTPDALGRRAAEALERAGLVAS